MIHVEIDAGALANVKDAMEWFPAEAKAALNTTLNEGLNKVASLIQDEVAENYAIKKVGVKKTLTLKKSTRSTLTAEVIVTDRRAKISGFKFKADGPLRIAKVQIKRGSFVRSSNNPPLFVGRANKTTKKKEVFIRTPHDRFKMSFGFTLSIPQMVENDEVYSRVAQKTLPYIEKRFEHNLERQFIKIAQREGLL